LRYIQKSQGNNHQMIRYAEMTAL